MTYLLLVSNTKFKRVLLLEYIDGMSTLCVGFMSFYVNEHRVKKFRKVD